MTVQRKSRRGVALLAAFAGVVTLLAACQASAEPSRKPASLTEVTDFGKNPGGLRMYEYVPNSAGAHPPVLVAVHQCTGSGPGFHAGTAFAELADRYGFIVVYPDANSEGQCFDTASSQALKRDGDSDPTSVVSMVKYAEEHHKADAGRVYVTGASSGANMTNVLLADYPDLFKAGSVFMGVPFGCFPIDDYGSDGWRECSSGRHTKTPQKWGDLVRDAYPGYKGARPRVQLWHGTEDDTLNHKNLGEEIKQWTDVLGVSPEPVLTDRPKSGWTRTRYEDDGKQPPLEVISVEGGQHDFPNSGMEAMAISFLGLDRSDNQG
ncbi:PHB depolymerase family esterase [Streptomyces sp. UH6]|uniref:extracellular catalytic domain type 1 short-chain-length polyhydroxyalkanoate depolymerase n=1 Tax=Streptomyces sp. UH6 TaxID=2748379 RepID=UPI00280BB6A9|nr:PHB depolymerase family esterase [Streptomyces sp. UH6]